MPAPWYVLAYVAVISVWGAYAAFGDLKEGGLSVASAQLASTAAFVLLVFAYFDEAVVARLGIWAVGAFVSAVAIEAWSAVRDVRSGSLDDLDDLDMDPRLARAIFFGVMFAVFGPALYCGAVVSYRALT